MYIQKEAEADAGVLKTMGNILNEILILILKQIVEAGRYAYNHAYVCVCVSHTLVSVSLMFLLITFCAMLLSYWQAI